MNFNKPIVLLLILLSFASHAQYYSDRPLEMTFEQSDMFFVPSYVNPFGTSRFGTASVLTMDNPLVDLQRNPANLSRFDSDTLPSNYFYLDMRNNRETVRNYYRGIYHGIAYPGYGYYNSSRSELTPLVSAVFFSRLPFLNKTITIGGTYQVISQGERYYAIPYDIYRNLAGTTFDDMTYEGTQDYNIVDRFSGADEMYHEGHSINTFVAWQVAENFSLGLKASRFLFERDGALGSNNLWNQQINYQSYWKRWERREQSYNHWDFTLGLNFSIQNSLLGLYAGLLTGDVNQHMERDDESMSKGGQPGSTSWSDYQSWYQLSQSWNHRGKNYYAGLQWERRISEEILFRFIYNLSRASQDLRLNSSIESESENDYYHEWSTSLRESQGFSKVFDFREGDGERKIDRNSIQAAISWNYQPNQTVHFGAIYGSRSQLTKTIERADAFSESYYYSHWENSSTNNSSTWERYTKAIEDKSINWEYDSRLRSFQIPVIIEYDYSNRFDFILGLNRSMNFWNIENSTLILYDYRERVYDDEILIEQMTGERITEPRERFSVVNTSLLAGFTITPHESFGIQIVISPGFEKNSLRNEQLFGFQVWLGINLRL